MFFQKLTRRNEIGANSYLLDLDGTRAVVDCGAHPKEDGYEALPDFGLVEYDSLDAIFISHSHLDHVGALPVLMREQPTAPVYLTEAAAALSDAMLHNSVNVMTSQRVELGINEYPFFTHRELDRLEDAWRHRRIGKPFGLGDDGVTVEFFDAGHILGSVGILFRAGGKSIFYTGDVNFEDQTLTKKAVFPEGGIDTLILETTRGSLARAPHYERSSEEIRFAEAIAAALDRGGSVLIPVFAMGKTQEVLMMLDLFKKRSAIPDAPVYIGGLSTKMTILFDKFADKVRRNFKGFQILTDMEIQLSPRKQRRQIEYSPGCIYALSSGMMTEKTVSNGFAAHFLDNPKNALLFVGYADPASPAGKIRAASHGDPITLDPALPPTDLLCTVDVFDFSGHAPREDLRAYANKLKPKKVILVHGDPDALEWFHECLASDLPDSEIVIPQPGEKIPL
ncbi:MBL fold metallo-hydrolase [soil metagenome]